MSNDNYTLIKLTDLDSQIISVIKEKPEQSFDLLFVSEDKGESILIPFIKDKSYLEDIFKSMFKEHVTHQYIEEYYSEEDNHKELREMISNIQDEERKIIYIIDQGIWTQDIMKL